MNQRKNAAQDSLISRTADFWLIGGASLLAWFVMQIFAVYPEAFSVKRHFANVAFTTATLSLFINYPHFAASYKIAYGRGFAFVRRHWFQLLAVPALLVGAFAYAYLRYASPNPLPDKWNIAHVTEGQGDLILLVALMYLIVGWHYIKQTFGCMMVYGYFDNYKLGAWQRRLLLSSLYIIWFANFVSGNVAPSAWTDFFGLPIATLGIPLGIKLGFDAVTWIMLGAVAYGVFFKTWLTSRKLPSLNYLTPLIALTVWWLPLFYQSEYYLFLVPMFHSMQYLPFAWRYESNRIESHGRKHNWHGSFVVLGLILLGYLGFEALPDLADHYFAPASARSELTFLIMANVLINIHHYFIDNCIWRFQQKEVRQYLFNDGAPLALAHPHARPVQRWENATL